MTIKNPTSHPRQICYSQLMVMLYAKCYVHRTVLLDIMCWEMLPANDLQKPRTLMLNWFSAHTYNIIRLHQKIFMIASYNTEYYSINSVVKFRA